MQTIVVGVDGSDASCRALAWAVEEARMRGAEVRALHAWTYPVAVGIPESAMPSYLNVDFAKEAEGLLDRAIKEATDGRDDAAVIKREVVEHGAAGALVEASRTADLVVVGSRGLGGFRGLLLGSVGHQVAQHAACPVVIVPHVDR